MKLFRLVVGVGLLVLVVSLPMPWLTINFLGQFNITLLDIYRAMIQNLIHPTQNIAGQPSQGVTNVTLNVLAMALTIILYPIVCILAAVSIWIRRIALVAGVMGILTGVLWIFGLDSLKREIIQQATRQGGSWAGLSEMITRLLASAISIGYGAYVSIIGGVILLSAFFLKESLKLSSENSDKLPKSEAP